MLLTWQEKGGTGMGFSQHLAIRCVPYVKKPEKFLTRHLKQNESKHNQLSRNNNQIFSHIAGLFWLCKDDKNDDKENVIENIRLLIGKSRDLFFKYPIMLCGYATVFAIVAPLVNSTATKLLFILSSIAFSIAAISKELSKTVFTKLWRRKPIHLLQATLFAICCCSTTLLIMQPMLELTVLPSWSLSAIPFFFFLLGISLLNMFAPHLNYVYDYSHYLYHFEMMHSYPSIFRRRFASSNGILHGRFILYWGGLIILNILSCYYFGKSNVIFSIAVATIIFIATVTLNFIVYRGHFLVKKASKDSYRFIEEVIRKHGQQGVSGDCWGKPQFPRLRTLGST